MEIKIGRAAEDTVTAVPYYNEVFLPGWADMSPETFLMVLLALWRKIPAR